MRVEAITTLTPAQQAAVADFVANRAPHIPGLARWRVVRQFQSREVELLYTVAPPRPARPHARAPWRSQLTIAWLVVLNGLAIGNWLLGGDELNGVMSYAQMDVV